MSGNNHANNDNDNGNSSNRNNNHQNINIQHKKNSSDFSLRRLLVEGARSVCNSSTLLTGGDIMSSNNNLNLNKSQNNFDIEKGLQNRTDKNNLLFNEGTSKQYSKVTNICELEKCSTLPLIHKSSLTDLEHDFTRTSSASQLNLTSIFSKTKLNEIDKKYLPPRSESSGQFYCPICYNTPTPPNDFFMLLTCKHVACRMCLEYYLKNEINESRTDLTCPQCSENIHPCDMEKLLQNYPQFIIKYEEFMIRRYLLSNPDSRWCPAPDCPYAVIAQGCASCPRIQCQRPECGISFCYHCKAEWHPDQTCDAARASRRLSGQYNLHDSSPNELKLRDDIKPCPKCQVLIVKMDDGSCNHMVCSICKAEFCWLCMKEISDLHYLSPSGCTFWGKKPWSRKKKLMWQLGTLVGAPVGIALVAGICVPAMIIGIPVWVGKKIYARYRQETKHKRNCALLSGVLGSILLSPVVAGLVVAIGIPILLFYVYGVVPISLCRTGCGVSPTRDGFKFEFHEDEEENTTIVNKPVSHLNISQQDGINLENISDVVGTSYGDISIKIESSTTSLGPLNLNTIISYDIENFSNSIETKLDGISTEASITEITTAKSLEIQVEVSES